MKNSVLFALLTLALMGFSACASQNPSTGQSQVRETREEEEHTGYGNPRVMDKWEQRGASGSPTGEKPARE